MRDREPKSLPEEWHPAFTAFRTALGHYEAKQDDRAREALAGIGLGSPLLEWKLWLRGLLAWVAGDDGRALENWSRLNPRRLPHRLAAPLRAKTDPAWPANPPALREQLAKQYGHPGTAGLVNLWMTDPAAVASTICAHQGQGITPSEWNLYLPDKVFQPR